MTQFLDLVDDVSINWFLPATMPAKSSRKTEFVLVINVYFSVHFPFSSRWNPLPPPLYNVVKKDEHVAEHGLQNLRGSIHLLSFSSRNPTLYGGGGRLVGKMIELFQHFWRAL